MTRILALFILPCLAGCPIAFKMRGGGSTHGSPTSSFGKTGRMQGVAYKDIDDAVVAEAEGFAAACFSDYDDMKQRWAPYEAKHRASFEKLKKLPSYYAQRDALAALAKTYYEDLKAAKLDVEGMTWRYLVGSGLAYEIDAYLANLHRQRGITRDILVFQPAYPPADDTVAADAYCLGATQEGTHRTKGISWIHLDEMLPEARAKQASVYLYERTKTIERDLKPAASPEHHYTKSDLYGLISYHQELELGSQLELGVWVSSVNTTGRGMTIRASETRSTSANHDCVETKQVDRIDATGRIRYRENCQVAASTTTITYNIELADAPTDVKKGDWLELDGVVKKVVRGKDHPITKSPKTYTVDLDSRLVHVVARPKQPGDVKDRLVVASYK